MIMFLLGSGARLGVLYVGFHHFRLFRLKIRTFAHIIFSTRCIFESSWHIKDLVRELSYSFLHHALQYVRYSTADGNRIEQQNLLRGAN
jgi:hypothetical protein